MQRNYDQGMKLLEEINFDMSKFEKAYFDPKKHYQWKTIKR